MAKRKQTIMGNSNRAVTASIGTVANVATISENVTGMLADGSDVMRDRVPEYLNKQLEKASKISDLEDQIEVLELEKELKALQSQ